MADKTKETGGMSSTSPEGRGRDFTVTEMGSARFVSLGGEGSKYKYETGPTELQQGTKGPPWSVDDSMHAVCDEAGIDYNRFIAGLRDNKSDTEMAKELGVSDKVIRNLTERFYKMDVPITGNYGQD